MKALLMAATAALCLSVPASAFADEDASPDMMADWNGPYVGVGLGYDFGHVKVADFDSYNGPPDIKYDPDGINVSGVVGYNYMLDSNFVVGGEGEVGWFGFTGDQQYPPYIGVRQPNDSVAAIKGRYLLAATVHVGFALDNWMAFVKGGVDAADLRASYIDNDPNGTTLVGGTEISGFKVGYTYGGGIEYMFPSGDMSTRIEYDRYQFGDIYQMATSAGGSNFQFRHSVTANVAKVTLAFHW